MKTKSSMYEGLATALQQTDGSPEAFRDVLLARFGGGFLQSFETLVEYAESTDDELMAPAAEMAAVETARRMVRPMLESKVQARLASLDAKASKKKSHAFTAR